MAIRDIVVSNNNTTTTLVFPLNETTGTIANESNGKICGSIVNPHWLINDHFYWKQLAKFKAGPAAGVTFIPSKSEILLVSSDTLVRYSPVSNSTLRQAISPHFLPNGYSGEAVYASTKQLIYYYNLLTTVVKQRHSFQIQTTAGYLTL